MFITKRCLFICDQNPFEPRSGSQQRSYHILKVLQRFFQIDLICFDKVEKPQEDRWKDIRIVHSQNTPKYSTTIYGRINKIFNALSSLSPYSVFPKDKKLERTIHSKLNPEDYDLIFVRYIQNFYRCGLKNTGNIAIDIDDLPEQLINSYSQEQKFKRLKKQQYSLYARRARFHTISTIKKVKLVFLPNAAQCKWENAYYLPNIPYLHAGRQPSRQGKGNMLSNSLLFVGKFNHTPNLFGIRNFIENILPIVLNKAPDSILRLVGNGIPHHYKEQWEKIRNIEMAGFVENLEPEYENSALVISPIHFGAGSNIKVLEAMAFSKAVVMTNYSFQPFQKHIKNLYNAIIALNDYDFAEKVILLLQNPELRNQIGERAKISIKSNYNFSLFSDLLYKALKEKLEIVKYDC